MAGNTSVLIFWKSDEHQNGGKQKQALRFFASLKGKDKPESANEEKNEATRTLLRLLGLFADTGEGQFQLIKTEDRIPCSKMFPNLFSVGREFK